MERPDLRACPGDERPRRRLAPPPASDDAAGPGPRSTSSWPRNHLDAIIALTNGPAWPTNDDPEEGDLNGHFEYFVGSSTAAAVSGYADITVPAGYDQGLPIGITFIGGRWAEPELIGSPTTTSRRRTFVSRRSSSRRSATLCSPASRTRRASAAARRRARVSAISSCACGRRDSRRPRSPANRPGFVLALLVVDGSAQRAGAHARRLIHRAVQREAAGCVGEASRSAGDRVDLDDRERGGTRPGRLPGDRGEQGVAVCRRECCGPMDDMVGMLITIVTCSVYLPRYVATPVPSRSKKRVGKTVVPDSTALTVPLNGVSAAAAPAAPIASDIRQAATTPTNSG